jgi:lipoyl(octanoyl) transferase
MQELEVRKLGVVPYSEALALQRALVEERRANRVPDLLLLLQHPPVITLGVRGDGGRSNIVVSEEHLKAAGIEVSDTGRGGDVTYHGPGQIVGYPIVDLRPDRCDVHRYVRDLEDVMIRVCADYGVSAGRIKGLTGAWALPRGAGPGSPRPTPGSWGGGERRGDPGVGAEKIGAIGVRISRWITSHGFAFNVSTNLDHFKLIVPCGISDRGVTSLERAAGRGIPLEEVEDAIIRNFCEVFAAIRLLPQRRVLQPT